jgi:alpha-tubulin suppressor-like RCC1 family protein
MKRNPVLVVSALALVLVGCSEADSQLNGGGEDLASVNLALTTVPSGVLCVKVVVTVAGQTVTPPLITVSSGASSLNLSLGRLPAGSASFQGSAYTVACASVTSSTTATWVSDSATATLALGAVTTVTLTFRPNNPVSVNANFVANVAQVSAGEAATYAAMADGTVLQWGDPGTGTTYSAPTVVGSLAGVAQVSAGERFACARKTDGTIWCWGWNSSGQLGPNATAGMDQRYATPVQVPLSGSAIDVQAGGAFACAILAGGALYCWGENMAGQLGVSTPNTSPTPIRTFGGVSAVSLGAQHTCIIGNWYGEVRCVGANSSGQLGDGTTLDKSSFVDTGLVNAVGIAAANGHTCAALSDGTIHCFGSNALGELGDGTYTQRHTPVSVLNITNAVQVVAGAQHTCALLDSGNVSCWGYGPALAAEANGYQNTPVTVQNLTGVTAVRAGSFHTCVETSNRSVSCWGTNASGQIGDRTNKFAARPTPVVF